MTGQVTIWGKAAAEREPAAYHRSWGRTTWFDGAECFDELLAELPDDGVGVTLGHGGERVGELAYGEITSDGVLNVVCVLSDDTITKVATPTYFSPELRVLSRGAGSGKVSIDPAAALTGLALTTDPATVAPTPIEFRRGDIRSRPDRGSWPLSWKSESPLLARCVDTIGDDWRQRTATRLHRDPGIPPELAGGWVDPDGRPLAPSAAAIQRAALPGGMHRGPSGRIISVH